MFASLLPGVREIRAPLAAGYVWLVTAWLAVAPLVPPKAEATGVIADVYAMVDAVGVGTALVAASFGAYVAGLVSVSVTSALGFLVNEMLLRRGARLNRVRPTRLSVRQEIRTGVLRRLSERFEQQPEFRTEIESHLTRLGEVAQRTGRPLPAPLSTAPSELVSTMRYRPGTRIDVLRLLFDLDDYAEDLAWDSRFIRYWAPPEVLEERDRLQAEAVFRYAIAVPISALVLVLAVRVSPWWLLAGVVPAWLLGLSVVSQIVAWGVVIRSAGAGPVSWPALDRAVAGEARYRPIDDRAAD